MSEFTHILVVSWLAGLAAFAGGAIAATESSIETETKREIIHGIIAFGGGILLAAVAFALVPEGMAVLKPLSLMLAFCSGGALFCFLEAWLSRRGGIKAQFTAMLLDFVPEAVSLGAVFGHDPRLGLLLALFIGIQNLPEGFNSFREIVKSGLSLRATYTVLLSISLLGPVSAAAGYLFLQEHVKLTAGIMSFAAGGIVYLVFQDIAPQATMRRHWTPPLGAVLGFAVGLIGKQLLG
ncbi:MAG: divalent cation transporter [Pseudomonadales bacterium]|nr:divalent cation transporter [Pseudomonadales bacterium]